jgi:CelD/BcsL family acetyltransferase involved in cellulose biosynthesis
MNEPRRPSSPGLTHRLICDEDEWDAVRPHWQALHAASPYASPPLDFHWLREWWRIYGPTYGTGGLQIVTAWRGHELVAAVPLYQVRHDRRSLGLRQLRFLSTGEAEYEETCPDYLDTLCLRGEEEAWTDVLWDCLNGLAWDHLELLDLPQQSPLLSSRRLPRRATTVVRGTCPVADLTGGFDAYLGRLSSNGRQQARRLLRDGEKARVTFDIAAANETAAAFDDLVRLHQARWTKEGKPGVFAAPRFTAFHREIVRQWVPQRRAVLARLSIGGEPVAVLYGLLAGSRFHFYQSGVRRDLAVGVRSPGNLAHLRLMQALAEQGVTAYDFLRGASSYKERLSTREERLMALQVWRPTLRATTCRSGRLVARAVRRGMRFQRSRVANR